MKKQNIIIIAIGVILIAAVGFFAINPLVPSNGNVTVEDMVGRNVTIPSNPDRIVSTSSPLTSLIYMIAPDKLAALSSTFDNGTKYVQDKYRQLPVIGAWHGKKAGNDEALLSLHPSFIIDSPRVRDGKVVDNDLELILNKFSPIPVVAVPETANLTNLNKTYDFLGKVLHSESSANKLKEALNRYLTLGGKTKDLTKNNPKKVYYAQSEDGLTTSPPGSEHAQVLDIIGAKNVVDIDLSTQTTQISIEQVSQWNPEIIITNNENFFKNVYTNPQWSTINAVKNKQVYLTPNDPFNWFDMPPGSNMIIGIPWTLKVVYGEQNKDLDLKKEVKEFYASFYHYDLTDDDVSNLLKSSTPDGVNIN
ncbi:MAG: ABC transporter substrate-binding protein [Methanobrevibacter sp.]|jgi:iron complex transport system substrate-binding protein|nr:ABC transporter substrate-binding protein [Candidatus Methanovirga aequatorialis]